MDKLKLPAGQQTEVMDKEYDLSRRNFIRLAGGIAGAGALLSAANSQASASNTALGKGDTALLNLLYILQQLEAAFYSHVVASPYAGISQRELLALKDVRDQEAGHVKEFRALLGSDAVTALTPDFSAIDFTDRNSVLAHAASIEDMVISGFNGAANLFSDRKSALTVGKMAMAEARHSAYFRDLHTPNSFASAGVDDNGLGHALSPAAVFENASVFIRTKFDASNLPNA